MKRFQTTDGLSLAYRDEGEGDVLLCLAGLTRNGTDFDHFAAAMADGHRILRLDSRGRGGSDHDPNFENYNAMTEAADAVALLDHLGIERATVIGSSRGGMLGMVIAATAPGRLRGVVLNDVGPDLNPQGLAHIMSYLGKPPAARTLGEAAAGLEAAMGADFPGVPATFWAEWAARSYRVTDDGLALTYDPKLRDATEAQIAAADPDGPGLWPLFEALTPVPALVLRAEHSNVLSPETVEKMQAVKPDLRAATVANRGHIPRLDEPDALGPIREFLESLP